MVLITNNILYRRSYRYEVKHFSITLISMTALILTCLQVNSVETATFRQGRSFHRNSRDIKYIRTAIEAIGKDNAVINSTRIFTKLPIDKKVNNNGQFPSDGKPAAAASSDDVVVQVRHMETLTLAVTVDGEKYILDLQINKYFLADNYKENLIGQEQVETIDIDVLASNCYYTGVVRDYKDSLAAVSTCNGIVGMFRVNGEMFEISAGVEQGSKNCLSCRHYITRSSENNIRTPFKCGFKEVHQSLQKRKKRGTINVWPQDWDGVTRIVEVYGCNDFNQYQSFNQDQNAVLTRMKNLVNMASALYHELNIYLVLVGAEVWTTDKISVNLADYNKFLEDFTIYGDNSITQSRDVAILLTSKGEFVDGVIGLANLGTACDLKYAYCFVSDLNHSPGYGIDVVAHEIGHTLGLRHDNPQGQGPCPCDDPSGVCIMDPSTESVLPTKWSTCSKTNLTNKDSYERYYCLFNNPSKVYDQASLCGNGLVEPGEQCDCGKAPTSECNPNCCSSSTCQLINNAQCAYGRCCDVAQCQIKPKYTECRPAAGDCDLSEYCSGSDYLCPSNVYKSYDTPCTLNNVQSYCYEGQCKTKQSQCLGLAPTVSNAVADDICYTTFNVVGDETGNCGPTDYIPAQQPTYVKCQNAEDAECGLLQCNYLNNQPATGNYNIKTITIGNQQFSCLTSLDSEKRQFSFVPNGATCGTGKVCQNQKCVALTQITTCAGCSNQGVCNNLGQCHCNPGFGGASCNAAGEGGSPHSNAISYNQALGTPTTTSTTTTSTTTTTTTAPGQSPPTSEVGASATTTTESSVGSSTRNKKRETILLIIVPAGIAGFGLVFCFVMYCFLTLADEDVQKQLQLQQLQQQQQQQPPFLPGAAPY